MATTSAGVTRKRSRVKKAAVTAAVATKAVRPRTRSIERISRKQHYHVYVVELSDEVWNIARFRKSNPNYALGKPFVYVGMTGLDPDLRFDKHKAGIQSNSYVRRFGLRLLPGLYTMYNPMPYDGARDMEVELGIALREAGYGVWQA